MSPFGIFETCRRTLRVSANEGRPEVTGPRSKRRDRPVADIRNEDLPVDLGQDGGRGFSDKCRLPKSAGPARMSKTQITMGLIACAVLVLNSTFAQAGPCNNDIARFEAAIRQSAGNPMAGLTARQSVAAQLNRQPTVASMKREEERLKSEFAATMARAKRLDAKGDRSGCNRALNAAKRMYIL
jgi:hypothetical protein